MRAMCVLYAYILTVYNVFWADDVGSMLYMYRHEGNLKHHRWAV